MMTTKNVNCWGFWRPIFQLWMANNLIIDTFDRDRLSLFHWAHCINCRIDSLTVNTSAMMWRLQCFYFSYKHLLVWEIPRYLLSQNKKLRHTYINMISKVFEIVINSALTKHLESNNLLSDHLNMDFAANVPRWSIDRCHWANSPGAGCIWRSKSHCFRHLKSLWWSPALWTYPQFSDILHFRQNTCNNQIIPFWSFDKGVP